MLMRTDSLVSARPAARVRPPPAGRARRRARRCAQGNAQSPGEPGRDEMRGRFSTALILNARSAGSGAFPALRPSARRLGQRRLAAGRRRQWPRRTSEFGARARRFGNAESPPAPKLQSSASCLFGRSGGVRWRPAGGACGCAGPRLIGPPTPRPPPSPRVSSRPLAVFSRGRSRRFLALESVRARRGGLKLRGWWLFA